MAGLSLWGPDSGQAPGHQLTCGQALGTPHLPLPHPAPFYNSIKPETFRAVGSRDKVLSLLIRGQVADLEGGADWLWWCMSVVRVLGVQERCLPGSARHSDTHQPRSSTEHQPGACSHAGVCVWGGGSEQLHSEGEGWQVYARATQP